MSKSQGKKKRSETTRPEVVHGKNLLVKAGKIQECGESKLHLIAMPEAKTSEQQEVIDALTSKTCVLINGPAGCGKTFMSCMFQAYQLEQRKVKNIIITRSALYAMDAEIGHLPGTAEDKLNGFLFPMLSYFEHIFGQERFSELMENHTIKAVPLGHIKGLTISDSIIIVDEAQNCSIEAVRCLLTRVGRNTKLILQGDLRQQDLRVKSGLLDASQKLADCPSVGICEMTKVSIIRSPFVKEVEEAYESFEERQEGIVPKNQNGQITEWAKNTLDRAESSV